MAQFDVHRLAGGGALVVDCQSELLSHLGSRFVVPLVPRPAAPHPARRLNPLFVVDGAEHVLLPQFAAAIDRRQLGPAVASLAEFSFAITDALEVLISGV